MCKERKLETYLDETDMKKVGLLEVTEKAEEYKR